MFLFLSTVDLGVAPGLLAHFSARAAEPFASIQPLWGEGELSRAVCSMHTEPVGPPWELLAVRLHRGFPSLSQAPSCATVKWARYGIGERAICALLSSRQLPGRAALSLC